MFIELLLASPIIALAWAAALIISLTVHEFSHALVGKLRGDTTAEEMGRLTLNPLAHLDVLGTLMLLVVGFGWAKPVPFDPRRLKSPLLDGATIALAGPFANLVMASLSSVAFRELGRAGMLMSTSALPAFLIFMVLVNMLLLFFNLIPVPPLDGSKVLDAILVQTGAERARIFLERNGPRILLALVILSLVSPLNVFFFVQQPATFACDQMTQTSCFGLLDQYIGQ